MLSKFTAVAPDRLLIFANVDFKRIDELDFGKAAAAELEHARELGARGLKIFKSLGLTIKDMSGQVVAIDDPRLDPIWDICGKLKMPVLIHAADPVAFFRPVDRRNERWMQLKRHPDWSFHGPGFPTYEQVLAQQDRMIARHPQTVFISAHLSNSGEDLARLSRWLDETPNVYVDISGRVPELGRQPYAARRFLIRYQDRVLFGTDRYPGRADQPRNRIYYRFLETDDEYFDYYDHPFPPEGEWKIHGVFLPDEVLRKIYHENAERALAGLMPRAISVEGRASGQ
jgi:predicted TIM-barrel fold metal-dependent hydrolase